ncbi:phosphotransferase [Streptomyces sp. HNM0574]|uniref:maltokinase N-terminal cap-like domain-containing protein n=1 Tax=Streptomyces sp. HNM0574 TaxID=2714954 RepID=UPI00146CBE1D|nr:phosphotransferase [Streptomyces sp. HNM0574]NLU67064.1 phosphotransferase [Streptomyces sp. HNM0574]
MSERSLSLTAAPAHAGSAAGGSGGLLHSLAPLLTEWLPRQRWFAGKGRPIGGFTLVGATELLPCSAGGATPGLLHLLVRAHQPAPVPEPGHGADGPGGQDGDGGPAEEPEDCYQLLLGVRTVLPPALAPALIGRPARGPLRGFMVYEALSDPRLAGLLLERLRAPGRLGPLVFAREPESVIPSGLRPRPLSAEQSNSSVVYGTSYILKVFRRVGPGLNPDLELPLALARGGCARVPAPTAWFEARTAPEETAGSLTLGVLQPFLPGSHDGWQLALRALADGRDFTASARALGHATAEVHTGLAASLPTTVLHRPQLEALARDMARRLEAAATAVPALLPYRAALRGAFRAVAELGRGGYRCRAQRVHGDLHLGQVLHGPDGRWTLIDFEGEPDRPLGERRVPQPVVRDVAGMLRSFDYAASHRPGQADGGGGPEEWAGANRAAFCAGYADASGADPRAQAVLLRAYETDKAIYEVLYEARHRPSWLPIPLSAIRRLAAPPRRSPQ